jgi:hypothetical protein
MRSHRSGKAPGRSALGAALAAGLALSMAGAASAAQASPGPATLSGPVSPVPASGTPFLSTTTATEQVRQLVQCGGTMYAVGSFTEIGQGNTVYSRNNAFSFSATAPYSVTAWDPNVNGEVDSIAFNGTDCADAYIGGQFTSVGGTAAKNIAEVSTTTGAVEPAFAHDASAAVNTLLGVDGHLLAGGAFAAINGEFADKYMVSLSPATGLDDGFLHLNISGRYQYSGVFANTTFVYNQQLSHSGKLDLVEGDFTSVGSLPRQQIFMLNLTHNPAKVTGWSSPEWDGSKGEIPNGYPYQCGRSEPFYIRAASWSPNDATVYIADTGFHPWNLATGSFPRSGLCDAVAAFPATQSEVLHKWINYTGCNSLYSTAADSSAVYAGGHEQWADDSQGCKDAGPGAISAPGTGGFHPTTGALWLNAAGTAGRYSRGRGHGADDMLLTGAGLWIASDNYEGTNTCGGVSGHAGICFLPYS